MTQSIEYSMDGDSYVEGGGGNSEDPPHVWDSYGTGAVVNS